MLRHLVPEHGASQESRRSEGELMMARMAIHQHLPCQPP